MAITVSKLEISNYRSCQNLVVALSRFTALIGYNNAGKSNILEALSWLLKKYSLSASEFWDPAHPVVVSCELSEIDEADLMLLTERPRAQIAPFIAEGNLKIRRTQPHPTAKAAEMLFEVLDPATNEWRNNPTGIDNALGVLLPEPIKIGAMEDAEEDSTKAKTSTTIGKLLAEFTEAIQQAHADELDRHLYEVARRISSNGDVRIAELGVIDAGINSKLQDIFPGMAVRLHFDVPDVGSLIKAGTLKVRENDGIERDFGSYGHGAQRSIQMTLVRHLAEVKKGDRPAGTTLLLIDEPELYLHPFAVEQVRVALKQLSKKGYQVVISTHSAQMVQSEDAQYVLLIRKVASGETIIRKRLRDAIEVVVPDAQHQTEHLFSLTNSSQFLFSDSVLIVEGKTERKLLPAIYQACAGRSLGQARIGLIQLDGTPNLGRTLRILAELDLPTKAIVDLDYAFVRAPSDGFISDDDPDLASLKNLLGEMQREGQVSLDPGTGLPKKGDHGSAADAYMLLASRHEALGPIENLHVKLKERSLWLWTRGSIDTHLGLAGKNDVCWAGFQKRMLESSYQAACGNDSKALELIDWLNA